jgi:hypothetical protein
MANESEPTIDRATLLRKLANGEISIEDAAKLLASMKPDEVDKQEDSLPKQVEGVFALPPVENNASVPVAASTKRDARMKWEPAAATKLETTMRKIIGVIGGALMIAMFFAGLVAYFVYRTDPATNIMYDGFGRPLSEAPFLMRLVFGQERLWAGWLWFVGDMVIFWGGFFVGCGLASWGFKESDPGQ